MAHQNYPLPDSIELNLYSFQSQTRVREPVVLLSFLEQSMQRIEIGLYDEQRRPGVLAASVARTLDPSSA